MSAIKYKSIVYREKLTLKTLSRTLYEVEWKYCVPCAKVLITKRYFYIYKVIENVSNIKGPKIIHKRQCNIFLSVMDSRV